MKISRMWESMRPQEELIASFGEARLLRYLDGRTELRGGSKEDRQQAKEWISLFFHEGTPRGLSNRS